MKGVSHFKLFASAYSPVLIDYNELKFIFPNILPDLK